MKFTRNYYLLGNVNQFLKFMFTYHRYEPLVEHQEHHEHREEKMHAVRTNGTNGTHGAQKIYNKWLGILETQLNSKRTIVLYKSVPYHRVNDYKFVFEKLLQDLNESDNYKVYGKKGRMFNTYHIKAKPTNIHYQNRIIRNSHKTWNLVFKYFHESIMKNSEGRSVIVKRTNDRGLAEWYRDVVDNSFMDHVVEIQQIMTSAGVAKFQVIVNCNIKININVNT